MLMGDAHLNASNFVGILDQYLRIVDSCDLPHSKCHQIFVHIDSMGQMIEKPLGGKCAEDEEANEQNPFSFYDEYYCYYYM